jgi:dephospho-CoA kinase
MKLIGITGGIGSGKSLIARIFSCLGIPVYNADDRARWLSDNDPDIRRKVITLLGEQSYVDDKMNRKWIASRVFNDSGKLDSLNSIIHPVVGSDFSAWVARQHAPYVLKEAALIYESGSYKQLDDVITVSAPEHLRVKRIQRRDPHRSRKEIESIIKRQLSDEDRKRRSTYEIVNDDYTLVIPQVLQIHDNLFQAVG